MSHRCLLILASILALAALPRAAAAGDLNAHLECKIGVKDAVTGKKLVFDGDLTCQLVLDDGYPEVDPDFPTLVRGVAWLTQANRSDEGRVLESFELTGDPANTFALGVFKRGADFAKCGDLIVHAQIASGDEAYWEGDLALRADCKKPKQVKARLACTYYDRTGAAFQYPGNGAKKKPRIDSTMTCAITVPGKAPAGLTATLGVVDAPPQIEPLYQDDARAWTSFAVLEPDLDVPSCTPFTVSALLTNGDGQPVYAASMKIAQACSD